jgi:hypothetical protein
LPMSIALLLLRFLRFSLKMWSRSWPRFTPGHPSKYRSQEVSSLSFFVSRDRFVRWPQLSINKNNQN